MTEENKLFYFSENPSDEEIIAAIKNWLGLLANEDYATAIQTVQFYEGTKTESFKSRIETFFGEEFRSKPILPTEDVLQRTEIYRTDIPEDCKAVVGFFIPLKNGYGIWTTFLLVKEVDKTYFQFEIFHL